jgi:hypothetical protein
MWSDESGPALGVGPDGDLVMGTTVSGTGVGRLRKLASGHTPLAGYQWAKQVYQTDLPFGLTSLDVDGQGLLYVLGGGTLSRLRVMPTSDADGDGYPPAVDCDDANPSVHPGAPELVGDGIDQDCNGSDLTIVVKSATWRAGALSVSATSKDAGGLSVLWYGAMTAARNGSYSITAAAPIAPARVWVLGPEGAVSAPVRVR